MLSHLRALRACFLQSFHRATQNWNLCSKISWKYQFINHWSYFSQRANNRNTGSFCLPHTHTSPKYRLQYLTDLSFGAVNVLFIDVLQPPRDRMAKQQKLSATSTPVTTTIESVILWEKLCEKSYLRRPPVTTKNESVILWEKLYEKYYVRKTMWDKLSATSTSHNRNWKCHTVRKVELLFVKCSGQEKKRHIWTLCENFTQIYFWF